MSIQAVSWVLEHCEATLGARCLMFAIANHADEGGANCWASVDTLAREARLSRKGTQAALRRLEAEGQIEAVGLSRYGTVVYRISGMAKGGEVTSPLWDEGAKFAAKNGSSTSPKPSLEPPSVHKESPLDSSLLPLLADVNRVVRGKEGARPISSAAFARACERYGDRDLAAEAEDFAGYWLEGPGHNRPLRDVAAAWRRWLRTAPAASRKRGRPRGAAARLSADLARLERMKRGDVVESSAEEVAAA